MKKHLSKTVLILTLLLFSFCFSQTDDLGIKKLDLNNIEPAIENKKDDAVFSEVEQMPEFPGGLNSFRMKISQNFEMSEIPENAGKLTTTVNFIIEKDGSLSEIKAIGNNYSFNKEAMSVVQKIPQKWNPAKIGGKPVRYKLRLPLTMSFE